MRVGDVKVATPIKGKTFWVIKGDRNCNLRLVGSGQVLDVPNLIVSIVSDVKIALRIELLLPLVNLVRWQQV